MFKRGDMMNEKERAIIELIRQNPFLSQKEMADTLTISRPALANLISGLIRQGKIAGRAYILPEEREILCIGGANVDRKFQLQQRVQLGTSNPANAIESVGGVARNIAENLGRLGHKVRLLTTAGKDADWLAIESASQSFMNLQSIEQLPNHTTGSYSAILDSSGELILAIANMDVYEELSPAYLNKHELILSGATLIVVDLNCPKETVRFLQRFASDKQIPLAIVPVSSPKMNRLPDELHGVTWMVCNVGEAESYLDTKIDSSEAYQEAVLALVAKGAQFAVITAGSKGVYFGSAEEGVGHLPAIKASSIVDVTGAGDAFVGATLHGWLDGLSMHQAIQTGLLNAAKTLASPYTVRTELSATRLTQEMEEL
jgi:sugar/nucleoside kinase (ribokinase family)/DNA-binding CsgD family transcriptional regulator